MSKLIFEKIYDNKDEEKIWMNEKGEMEFYFYKYYYYIYNKYFDCFYRQKKRCQSAFVLDIEKFREKRTEWEKKIKFELLSDFIKKTFEELDYINGYVITTYGECGIHGVKRVNGWIFKFNNKKFFLVDKQEFGFINTGEINIYYYKTGILVNSFYYRDDFTFSFLKEMIEYGYNFKENKIKSMMWKNWCNNDYKDINK